MSKQRKSTPIRFRALRVDAKIEAAERTIERKLKLPPGCVRLMNPGGRKIRSDATVQALLDNWDW